MNGRFEAAPFEVMPFGGGHETPHEQERPRRRAGAGMRAGGGRAGGARAEVRRPPSRRQAPTASSPAYPEPAWPWARWDAPPEQEPVDDDGQGEISRRERAVLDRFPAELRAVLLAMPNDQRPRYVPLGMLPRAARNSVAAKPGLYVIVFSTTGRRRAYNGQSSVNVRARLEKHLLGAVMLGLEPFIKRHEVFFAPPPEGTKPRTTELAINRSLLEPHPGVLTNQRHELEAELLGEAWL